jgi:2-iminobutanoate/2-iminopropanoate deaminase
MTDIAGQPILTRSGRRSVTPPGLAHGANPIPAACRRGPLVATGAIRGVDVATGQVPETLADQVHLAFANLRTILTAAGADTSDVVKVTIYLSPEPDAPPAPTPGPAALQGANRKDSINIAWLEMFPEEDSRPARHVQQRPLPGGLLVQVDALAYVDERSR